MPSVDIIDLSNKKVGTVDLSDAVFAAPVNEALLYEAVRHYLAGTRRGTAKTKTRHEVAGSGKKLWKQKGTGRARAGSSRSPLWAGGAVVFGPQPRNYAYRLPKSARKAAICSALTTRHADGKLVIVDAITLPEPKTKRMVECLKGLGVETSALIVLGSPNEAVMRAARNLPRVKVLLVGGLNVYDVLKHATLVMTREAVEQLAARLGEAAA